MSRPHHLPVLELSRGMVVESVHYGSIAIVNSLGKTMGSYGDPTAITYLRSSAKPFQLLPFIEDGGQEWGGFSQREIAIMCASHTGTDDHFKALTSIQTKINVNQDDLLCGVHSPIDISTRNALIARNEQPTPNRHNCSGKHSGMLAHSIFINSSIQNYIDYEHPIQTRILRFFSEMCEIEEEKIALGIDGCSAPVFAVPLLNAALAYARLCDPASLSPKRASACQTITDAMVSHPEMVSGPGTFDTRLMEATKGKIISKGGAEGVQQLGIFPDVIKSGSPGIGIALKISDGDEQGRARPAVALEILFQLGALTMGEQEELAEFGPIFKVKNWRNLIVGEARPIFSLAFESQS